MPTLEIYSSHSSRRALMNKRTAAMRLHAAARSVLGGACNELTPRLPTNRVRTAMSACQAIGSFTRRQLRQRPCPTAFPACA
eukprot:3470018-Pleurochrysis_carterae.AAC.1